MLERLIGERRVSAVDVERYVREMQSEISTLEQRLQRLRDAAGSAVAGAAAGIAAGAATVAATVARRGRKRGPGRPPGRPGRKPGRPAGTGRGPGRPPASASAAGTANAGGATAATTTGARARGGAKRGRKGATNITPEQRASRQLQGRYLALVRGFPEARRSYFAKVAKEKGREAAIREMQAEAKK